MDRIFVFVIGAIIGSFLNVCIHRIPKGGSIVSPASHCPHCKKSIPWYDNIPVFSYLVLAGKCRHCKGKISFRYPLVELVTAGLILLLYISLGVSAKFFIYSALTSALIAVTFIDLDVSEIPDGISVGGLAAGIVLAFMFPSLFGLSLRWPSFLSSILGAFAGGLSIYAMGLFGRLAFKKEAMGGGDVKLMAMIGSVLGWKLVLLAFFIAPVLGAISGVSAKLKGRDTIPYGPYLSAAAVVVMFFGNRILDLLFYGM